LQSNIGYVFMINGGAVLWSAKQQEIISCPPPKASISLPLMPQRKRSGFVNSSCRFSASLWMRQPFSLIISLPLHLQKSISIMLKRNISTFTIISSNGLLKKEKSILFIVPQTKWLPMFLQKHYHLRRSNILLMNSVS
jgi:hypothetical protein